MRINYGYIQPSTNSVNKGTQNVTNDAGKTFAEIASQKAAEADKEVAQEKTSAVLDLVGEHAPDEVKQAWTEAAKEMGGWFTVGGSWVSADGKHSHMTQIGVQIALKWAKGELDQADLLGNSVESAISAVEKWLYDLDHPLVGQPARSLAEQQGIQKEREFYEAFLDKLKNLSNSASKYSQNVSNYANRTYANIVPVKSVEADKEVVQEKSSVGFDSIGSQAPDAVKQAWMETEEEIGGHFATGGLWITYENGHVRAHITQIMVERFVRWYNGEVDPSNLLGNSVQSAINVVEKCIYDMDHPLPGQPTRSIEVQQQVMKERAFYVAFLEKLQALQ